MSERNAHYLENVFTHRRSFKSAEAKPGNTMCFLFLSIPSTVAMATSRGVRQVNSVGAFNLQKMENKLIRDFDIHGRFKSTRCTIRICQ